MLVLGIESTAHTFGVGITDGKEILANEKDAYKLKQINTTNEMFLLVCYLNVIPT